MSGQEPIAINGLLVRLNRPCDELDVKSVPSPFAVVLFTALPVFVLKRSINPLNVTSGDITDNGLKTCYQLDL